MGCLVPMLRKSQEKPFTISQRERFGVLLAFSLWLGLELTANDSGNGAAAQIGYDFKTFSVDRIGRLAYRFRPHGYLLLSTTLSLVAKQQVLGDHHRIACPTFHDSSSDAIHSPMYPSISIV